VVPCFTCQLAKFAKPHTSQTPVDFGQNRTRAPRVVSQARFETSPTTLRYPRHLPPPHHSQNIPPVLVWERSVGTFPMRSPTPSTYHPSPHLKNKRGKTAPWLSGVVDKWRQQTTTNPGSHPSAVKRIKTPMGFSGDNSHLGVSLYRETQSRTNPPCLPNLFPPAKKTECRPARRGSIRHLEEGTAR
jgi:hypothetical protein